MTQRVYVFMVASVLVLLALLTWFVTPGWNWQHFSPHLVALLLELALGVVVIQLVIESRRSASDVRSAAREILAPANAALSATMPLIIDLYDPEAFKNVIGTYVRGKRKQAAIPRKDMKTLSHACRKTLGKRVGELEYLADEVQRIAALFSHFLPVSDVKRLRDLSYYSRLLATTLRQGADDGAVSEAFLDLKISADRLRNRFKPIA